MSEAKSVPDLMRKHRREIVRRGIRGERRGRRESDRCVRRTHQHVGIENLPHESRWRRAGGNLLTDDVGDYYARKGQHPRRESRIGLIEANGIETVGRAVVLYRSPRRAAPTRLE